MEKAYAIALDVVGPDHAADFIIWLGKYFPEYNVPPGVIKKYAQYYMWRVRKKETNRLTAEYEYAMRLPKTTGPPDKYVELREDLRNMSVVDIKRNFGISEYKARRVKSMLKYKAVFKGMECKVLPFRDGKHEVVFIKFDFMGTPTPTNVWKIKDTYAQYARYKKLFSKLEVDTECRVRFGSDKGRQAGRIVWAQPVRGHNNEANNSDVR